MSYNGLNSSFQEGKSMEKSKVYYTNMKATFQENLPQKLKRLIKTAGIGEIDFENKYTAIKMHFGEPGNLAFLRPNYAAVVVNTVKELGGRPFLTDCNTLYVGGRKNALDHLDSAYQNGFSPFSTGCHVLIADGLKGTGRGTDRRRICKKCQDRTCRHGCRHIHYAEPF